MKRIFDLVFSCLALLILTPVFVFVSLIVRINMGSPVLYKQKRPGFQGEVFEIVKFRSMKDVNDNQVEMLSDSDRLTSLGRKIRSLSLDELPELWNVIKGDMSLVGPRPLLVEYLPLYSDKQKRRHDVKPGITGWAQVNGRNGISWEEKFKLDVWYVDHQSFWLDIKILLMTVKKVLAREGISEHGQVTAQKFEGNG
ncbi:MAG: sugar transferase [Gammaproteobacteria bacterium]|nr:sugar transferase [Gammaproteobacteria bacterium]